MPATLIVPRPQGIHIQADGSVVCRHRDVTCCPACAAHPHIVDVYGSAYYVPDPAERAGLLAEIAASDAEWAVRSHQVARDFAAEQTSVCARCKSGPVNGVILSCPDCPGETWCSHYCHDIIEQERRLAAEVAS